MTTIIEEKEKERREERTGYRQREREVFIAPSILATNPLNIEHDVEALHESYDWLHLDIMDGHFVRNLSFGPDLARAMHKRWPNVFIDAHLMVDRLEVILPLFLNTGVSSITVHAETEPQLLHMALTTIRKAGLKAGIAISTATSAESIKPILGIVDLVLVMSVTPGFGGQSLIESTLEQTRELASLRAARKESWLIQMDGGITEQNVGHVALAGCDVIVAGSAVFGSSDPAASVQSMRLKVKEALADAGI